MVSPSEGPAVDRGLLARLRADVGDETLRRYADAYLDLLPGRLDLVGQAVAAGERAEALRILTDVWVGAVMLGAARLAAGVRGLEAAVRTKSRSESEAKLALIRQSAQVLAAELRREIRHIGGDPPAQPPTDPPKR
jgi:hypothetical protein